MADPLDLTPHPEVVREQLARAVRNARLMRTLLKLSLRAAEERRDRERQAEREKADAAPF